MSGFVCRLGGLRIDKLITRCLVDYSVVLTPTLPVQWFWKQPRFPATIKWRDTLYNLPPFQSRPCLYSSCRPYRQVSSWHALYRRLIWSALVWWTSLQMPRSTITPLIASERLSHKKGPWHCGVDLFLFGPDLLRQRLFNLSSLNSFDLLWEWSPCRLARKLKIIWTQIYSERRGWRSNFVYGLDRSNGLRLQYKCCVSLFTRVLAINE